ncbi:MAG: hypothetical protein JSW07_19195, partial [bacterium]
PDGTICYEPDPSREYVQIDLASVDVVITTEGKIDFSSEIRLYIDEPFKIVNTDFVLESADLILNLNGDNKCLVLKWSEPNINNILKKLAANFFDEGAAVESELTLRIIFGDPIKEIRIDWEVTGNPRSFVLPGIKVTTPDNVRFSIILGPGESDLTTLAFALTFEPGSEVIASSNFAWERDEDRELQNDDERESDAPSLFELTATAQEEVSLVLMILKLDELKLPQFFRQLEDPIPEFDFSDPSTICNPTPFDIGPLKDDDTWDVKLEVNAEEGSPFNFPFLKQKEGPFSQYITVQKKLTKEGKWEIDIDFEKSEVGFSFIITAHIGSISLQTEVDVKFNWETFALKLEHDEGIHLISDKKQLPENPTEHLGLVWRFKGKEIAENKYHYFTLATKNYNYQLIQAPGASFEIDYVKASDEPITFAISDFVLSSKGINLTAEVTDRPARLNGIDTRFRFHGTRLEIVENKIKDFTLSGSGPMPPALVGDAMVDISLQFSQRNGNLTLVSGGARLRGNKLLHCKGTRFEFSIDAIGLKFVNDGRFHLYFTLTGSAQFVLAPGDDKEGALALLPKIKIDLVECPLTGDASVISKHVKFLIELPKKVSFNFLGCFEMELRAIGFVPQAEVFDGDGAMILTGQLKFAAGAGDTPNARVDFHGLYIGLPRKGSFIPRIHFKDLAVNLNFGAAFKLSGRVDFVDSLLEKGFSGEGMLQIQGLPTLAASFAFLRVRQDETSPWLRAWFIYLEVRQVSFMIPVIQLYLREVGLGFGYRFTLVSIKAADRTNDVRKLLQELKKLSRTQGDLSKRDRWEVDLEKRGEDPRWTIVLRAMISQTSASPSPLRWDENAEKKIACVYLFDAIIAFRSDLTFFMAVRAWLNTNYYDYVNDVDGIRESPLFSGFILFSPQQKRLLAHLASNPDGKLGSNPPLPDFVQTAIANSQFSVTLLVEPGLFHYEMGWPNMLRWKGELGPLKVEFRGGFIFRISRRELVIGNSFLARGRLEIKAEFDFGIIGLRLVAIADVAYGARYIGVISFVDIEHGSALYGAIGLELRIEFSIHFWIRIYLLFITITLRFRFSFTVGFTAGLEIGLNGVPLPDAGLRGTGTVSLSVMGHSMHLSVKLGVNESAVTEAYNKTEKFLHVGLEATDVESMPGIEPPLLGMKSFAAAARHTKATLAHSKAKLKTMPRQAKHDAQTLELEAFNAPNYTIFAIRNTARGQWNYFVLLPQGEYDSDNGTTSTIRERGFLPVPPNDGIAVIKDFILKVPKVKAEPEGFMFEHFEPLQGGWNDYDFKSYFEKKDEQDLWADIFWQADWDATILEAEKLKVDDTSNQAQSLGTEPFYLKQYLRNAFITEPIIENNEETGEVIPIRDPDIFAGDDEVLEDERIQNPSDNSFEAAVRGAVEQFRGSPFFKKDAANKYEQVLDRAFSSNTTIYSPQAELPEEKDINDEELREIQLNEQAHQLRGMVIHDVVADLREYAEATTDAEKSELEQKSIAFRMGLVFRTKGEPFFTWLKDTPDSIPKIYQRIGPESSEPNVTEAYQRKVQTFNVEKTDFSKYAPQFQKVRLYTDANTIAIAWDLVWTHTIANVFSKRQAEPEHHLMHYQVRRRALDGSEREVVYTVKNAEGLHREASEIIFKITGEAFQKLKSAGIPQNVLNKLADLKEKEGEEIIGAQVFLNLLKEYIGEDQTAQYKFVIMKHTLFSSLLKLLKPRFQLVDHFNQETLDDQAALPATGRSYLYTIIPVDFAGKTGRPLTLVATRYPNLPPQVPVNGELIVRYRLNKQILSPDSATDPVTPKVIIPDRVHVEWSEPVPVKEGPIVPVAKYLLIFRKDTTLPIGSYGLDSTTQGPRTKSLPTTNARALPTDIKIELTVEGSPEARFAEIPMENLKKAGVFPPGDTPEWRPDSWQVFFQTVSINEVPSALAPVHFLLRVEAEPEIEVEPDVLLDEREERRPAQIEWLPYPIKFMLLPAEDQRAISGVAHFPMPAIKITNHIHASKFTGDLNDITFQQHPAGIRCIRFRWNQGPSHLPDYPLNLNAGYHILELDIDAHTTETFEDETKLAEALRQIQEVQMLPAEDLLLTPGDTLTTNQWEAWYASIMLRRKPTRQRAAGSEISLAPWYSWRESILEWPEWSGLTDGDGERSEPLHPLLQKIIDVLNEDPDEKGLDTTYNIDLQISPPIKPGNRSTFMGSTAPRVDPYGWGILQRFGLSVTFSLRDEETGEIVAGQQLLDAIKNVLEIYKDENQFKDFFKFLHVELLFQSGRSIRLESEKTSPDDLLAIVQLSLRPTIKQYLKYGKMMITGPARKDLNIVFNLTHGTQCSIINQADPASGQLELTTEPIFTIGLEYLNGLNNGIISENLRNEFKNKGFELSTDATVSTEEESKKWLITDLNLTYIIINEEDKLNVYYQISPIKRTIILPLNGLTNLVFRSTELPEVGIALKNEPDQSKLPHDFFEYKSIPIQQIIIKKSLHELNDEERKQIRQQLEEALGNDDQAIKDFAFEPPQVLPVTDELSTYFIVPKFLAATFSDISDQNGGKQWAFFKRYAEAINSNDPDIPLEEKINIPTIEKGEGETIESVLPDFLAWSMRFFDFAGEVEIDDTTELGNITEGPWLATAYPRAGSPAYTSPDESGRLKYDHLLEDKWAHNYRYYIRPFGRYDLLWQSLRQSPALFPDATERFEKLPEATPDPQAGGLDVVLDRTQPVDIPLVLSSSRLDQASTPAKPAAPGEIWEVIVAQHPEQALIERNQTLYRQLAFRQIAFTLLRRFAFPKWIEQLEAIADYIIDVKFVENEYPDIPPAYPDKPDHIDFENVSEAVARSLDLPQRIGSFQQGALALQWEALPYFYEHRLLLVAQTASNVSSINEVIQRDYEYLSPVPFAIVEGIIQQDWKPFPPFIEEGTDPIPTTSIRLRQVEIPLKRFWDCLPSAAKTQWSAEQPDGSSFEIDLSFQNELDNQQISENLTNEFIAHGFPLPENATVTIREAGNEWQISVEDKLLYLLNKELEQIIIYNQDPSRKFSSLPDPEVIYQVIEIFNGNIEVQAEFLFDEKAPSPEDETDTLPSYVRRQLGQRFLAEILKLVPPAAESPQADFVLQTTLLQITETELHNTYEIPEEVLHIASQDNLLSVAGVFTRSDLNMLLGKLQSVDGYIGRPLSAAPPLSEFTEELQAKLKYPELPTGVEVPDILQRQLSIDTVGISWVGPMSDDQSDYLSEEYHSDLTVFQDAVKALLAAMKAEAVSFSATYEAPPPRP